MKDLIKFGLVLSLICFVSAGLLAAVNNATEEVILERRLKEENAALGELFPTAYDFHAVESEDKKAHIALDRSNQPLGYAFKTETKGYSSTIEALVAVDLDSNIMKVKILSQNETPGVGTKITEPEFLDKFKGTRLNQAIQVDTITGATISSSSLIDSIEKDSKIIKKLVKDKLKKYGK